MSQTSKDLITAFSNLIAEISCTKAMPREESINYVASVLDNYMAGAVKPKAAAPRAPSNGITCAHILTKGVKQGERCQRPPKAGCDKCSTHASKSTTSKGAAEGGSFDFNAGQPFSFVEPSQTNNLPSFHKPDSQQQNQQLPQFNQQQNQQLPQFNQQQNQQLPQFNQQQNQQLPQFNQYQQFPPPSSQQFPPPSSQQFPPPSSQQFPPPSSQQFPPPSSQQFPPPSSSSQQFPPPSSQSSIPNFQPSSSSQQFPPPSSQQFPPPSSQQFPPPSSQSSSQSSIPQYQSPSSSQSSIPQFQPPPPQSSSQQSSSQPSIPQFQPPSQQSSSQPSIPNLQPPPPQSSIPNIPQFSQLQIPSIQETKSDKPYFYSRMEGDKKLVFTQHNVGKDIVCIMENENRKYYGHLLPGTSVNESENPLPEDFSSLKISTEDLTDAQKTYCMNNNISF
jgi:hypothetical protein